MHVDHDSKHEAEAGFISAEYIVPFAELCCLGLLDGQASGWVQLTDLEQSIMSIRAEEWQAVLCAVRLL